ncbi:YceI family protein [Coraliomargarita sp. SDUM461004]|uniref:YceI family protein n=1 Tax=Thalassobacterium sedimentorum TaxID=3041258 RepID=A0ABU1AHW3_9BACT|nr:YceI family protein [Coraliomargarita sp. SDUM461004]MDQ8194411.1 YceI family protein [Coraliomargarita sp. SDUM461004]
MKKTIYLLTASILASLTSNAADMELYTIDPSHSSVKFSIRHFVAKTTGNFSEFAGTLSINREDLTQSSVEATIQIPSVDTDNQKRDAHLQEDDFFNAAQHPLMTFKSTEWKATDNENEFKVTGDLSFNGITKPVILDVELLGFGDGMRGTQLSGWEATTTLDRTEWGVNGGKPAVGDEVDVTINIEAHRK